MSRYKGRTDKAIIEREFPHHVDLLTPPSGFGNRLNEMYDWLTAHGINANMDAVGGKRPRIVNHFDLCVGVSKMPRAQKNLRLNFTSS